MTEQYCRVDTLFPNKKFSSPRLNIVQNHKLLFSFAFYITYNKKIRNIQVRSGCQAVQVLSLLPPVRHGEAQPRHQTLPDTPSLYRNFRCQLPPFASDATFCYLLPLPASIIFFSCQLPLFASVSTFCYLLPLPASIIASVASFHHFLPLPTSVNCFRCQLPLFLLRSQLPSFASLASFIYLLPLKPSVTCNRCQLPLFAFLATFHL